MSPLDGASRVCDLTMWALRGGGQWTSSPPTSQVLRSHPGWTDLHKHLLAVTQGVWPEGTLCRFAENDP